MKIYSQKWFGLGAIMFASVMGCQSSPEPDIAKIYADAARQSAEERVPVLVIPGIMGSNLSQHESDLKVWGAFVYGAADADCPEGARLLALPMEHGQPLRMLQDDVYAADVMDTVEVDIGLVRGLKLRAYMGIMQTLGVGKYRDQTLAQAGAVDYGGLHYTCYQFPYDWRRDISEQAIVLHEKILQAQQLVRQERGLPEDMEIKVDVVAHSMGGLVLRYYLRFGPHALPDDGSVPAVTWEGAKFVRKAIIVGTPNAGSVDAVEHLVHGLNLHPIAPYYQCSILGTMPAIYQLLPRPRHQRVLDSLGHPVDLYDPNTWEKYQWGLMDPAQQRFLEWLLPEETDGRCRQVIAKEHLAKILARAKQFHLAMDQNATLPSHLKMVLFLGDANDTLSEIIVRDDGTLEKSSYDAGDGTVLRQSALLDERQGAQWQVGLQSPIEWHHVHFLSQDHMNLINDIGFTNQLLFELLETP